MTHVLRPSPETTFNVMLGGTTMLGESTMPVRILFSVRARRRELEYSWRCHHQKLLTLSLGQWPPVLVVLLAEGMAV